MTYYPPRYLFRRYEIVKRIQPASSFLEIGAGNLKLSQELLRFFHNGTLIDYNEKTNTLFKELPPLSRNRLNLIISDFMSHNFQNTFDCIVACEVLEHVRKHNEFVQKMYQLLNKNGQLILSVPSRKKYWSKHDEIVGHLRRYEKEDIIKLLRGDKFTNMEIISYGFPFVNMLRWASILLAKYYYIEKKQWSQKKQSQESGIVQAGKFADILGLVVNKYTCFPFCLFSSFFNKLDLSNGYVISANKA
jgi:SAM-dependent methyltransferase